jgi:hypothetical protein
MRHQKREHEFGDVFRSSDLRTIIYVTRTFGRSASIIYKAETYYQDIYLGTRVSTVRLFSIEILWNTRVRCDISALDASGKKMMIQDRDLMLTTCRKSLPCQQLYGRGIIK